MDGTANAPSSLAATDAVVNIFKEAGVWHRIGENNEVTSCRDAARKRNRLGHEGIPLWDELKSLAFKTNEEASASPLWIFVHLRADRLVDMDKLKSLLELSTEPVKISEVELRRVEMGYGLVNPFHSSLISQGASRSALHVIDHGLLTPAGVPGTVMTNAGSRTKSVEFMPTDLPKLLTKPHIANISRPDPEVVSLDWGILRRKKIGIITGNAPESGSLLWNLINDKLRDVLGANCRGDISMPHVFVESMPEMGLSMELDDREQFVWEAISDTLKRQCEAGADVLAIACNTTQYFTEKIREVCAPFGSRFISMPECVAKFLRINSVESAAIVGISYVSDLGRYSAYRDALAEFRIRPISPELTERIHRLAYEVKESGADHGRLTKLRRLLKNEPEEYVIMALTELSLLLTLQKKSKRKILIDPLDLYAEAIVSEYLDLGFPLKTAKESLFSSGAIEENDEQRLAT